MFDIAKDFNADDTFDFDALVERAEAQAHKADADDADAADLYDLN